MATTNQDDFKLDIPCDQIESLGSRVTVPCHLSPEIDAVAMEIRWFKGTDCICLYKNMQMIEGRGYKDRVSLFREELEDGHVSLHMGDCKESDSGSYMCQVISTIRSRRTEELTVEVQILSNEYGLIHKLVKVDGAWTVEDRIKMEESVLLTELKASSMLELLRRSEEERKKEKETLQQQLNETRRNLDKVMKELVEKDQKISELEVLIERLKEPEDSQTTDLKDTSQLLTSEHRTRSQELPPDLDGGSSVVSEDAPDVRVTEKLHTPDSSVATSELRLVLLGRTECGKSAAGNIILGREESSQAGVSTARQQSESRQGQVAGRQVTVVDTPDWFSPELSLEELRQDVGLCIRLSAPGPHAFLLVIPVKQSTGEERGMLEKMEEIFWERCWRNTMILFTVTDEQQKKDIEQWLHTGDQEVQRIVEKCGDRFHCLNINDTGDGSQVSELLEQIKEMVGRNEEDFYSSDIYNEIREMEKRIIKEREEIKEQEIRRFREELDKKVQDALKSITEQIQELEGKLQQHEEQICEFERLLKDETHVETVRELEIKLREEIQQKEETQQRLEELKEQLNKTKREMEERHKEEMEEIIELYEGEVRIQAERNLMKIILPELHRTVWVLISKMQKQFSMKMEQKDQELLTLKQKLSELTETCRQLETDYQSALRNIEEIEARRNEEERDCEVLGEEERAEEGEGEEDRLLEGEEAIVDEEGDKESTRAKKTKADEEEKTRDERQEGWFGRVLGCCSSRSSESVEME